MTITLTDGTEVLIQSIIDGVLTFQVLPDGQAGQNVTFESGTWPSEAELIAAIENEISS